jgi:CRISPR-associated protein Csy1
VTARLDAARGQYAGGDFAAARMAAEAILRTPADHGEAAGARLLLVECARRSGDRTLALSQARAAVAAAPGDASAHYALAVCLDDGGDKVAALAQALRARELDGSSASVARFTGVLQLESGDVAGAIGTLQQATRLDSQSADGWNSLATALHHDGRLEDAEAAYRRALELKPDFPRAECNFAVLQRDQGRGDLAEQTLRACIARRPPATAYRPAFTALADLLRAKSELDEAAKLYLAAAKLAPEDSFGEMLDLGLVLTERGDPEQARRAFQHAMRQNPRSLRAALAHELTLPMLYADAVDVARSRESYARGLETLHQTLDERLRGAAREEIVDGLIWSNFFLAYQGGEDRALQERYAALCARALDRADASLRAPIRADPVRGRRIRVGFVSAMLREGTVGQYFARWLTDLDRSAFEVCFYPLGGNVDAVTQAIHARADRVRPFMGGDATPSIIVPVLRREQLDVLVYPEMGMDQVTFALAGLRIAPRQCAAWGHPVTTGHTTIDHFLSCDVMEPDEAQASYTERLTRLPGIGTRFARPALPPPADRAAFAIPADAVVMLCPQSLFKIHPDNDDVLARIVAQNPGSILVMFAGRHPAITDRFMRRLSTAFERHGVAIRERTRVLPHVSHEGYLAINRTCDLMLDTLYWSGGQTSVDALDCDVPVVTLPGASMRGRQSAGMLRLIGVEALIARDVDDYVSIATRLCAEPAWRAELAARVREGSSRLFDDPEPIAALEAFLRRIAMESV